MISLHDDVVLTKTSSRSSVLSLLSEIESLQKSLSTRIGLNHLPFPEPSMSTLARSPPPLMDSMMTSGAQHLEDSLRLLQESWNQLLTSKTLKEWPRSI